MCPLSLFCLLCRPTCGCVVCPCRWSAKQMPSTCLLLMFYVRAENVAQTVFTFFSAGKIPFIHVGNQVVSELGPIVQFTKAKLYIQWCDDGTAAEITRPRYSSPYSWPLSTILAYQKQWEVRRKMNAIGWGGKNLEQVYEDVSQCCQALSQRLGTQPFFFNKQPTELDALVFGHLFTILTTRLTSTELAERVRGYGNLLSFCRRIEQTYFEDRTS
uniref:Metaxin 2 n=1 Tax=Hippocampus comes TaxID=109280 RepID=A0A3Q2YJW7_HIPCM